MAEGKGISFSTVLGSCGESMANYLDLRRVVKGMLKKKDLPSEFRDIAKAAKATGDIGMLLGAMDFFGFSVFLETLDSLSGEGDEKHYEILIILCHELRHIALPALPQTKNEEHAVLVVKRILQTYLHPKYAVGERESKSFTSLGGTFYSETHGVAVDISKEAMAGVANFRLIMNTSLHGPHELPSGVQICSPIISLICTPPVKEFASHVKIEIPHCISECAANPEQFSVLTAQEEYQNVYYFHEDSQLMVDFSSDFCVTVHTKHFTSHVVVYKGHYFPRGVTATSKRKLHGPLNEQRKAASFDEVKSKRSTMETESQSTKPKPMRSYSASASTECDRGGQPCMLGYIASYSPRDLSCGAWKNVFYVFQRASTGLAEVQSAATKYFKCDISQLEPGFHRFSVKASSISFVPEQWSEKGWSGCVSSKPAEIEMDDVFRQAGEDVPMDVDFFGLFPPQVVYGIQIDQSHQQPEAVSICVERASRGTEKPVTLTVFPPSVSTLTPTCETRPRCVYVRVGLYCAGSSLCQSLVSSVSQSSHYLQLDKPDTIKFLAEISLQLFSVWQGLALKLGVNSTEIDKLDEAVSCRMEACFLMLYDKWLMQQRHRATLRQLLQSLEQLDIKVELNDKTCVADVPIPIDSHDELLKVLPRKIAVRWKFVARLLGMAQYEIESIDAAISTIDDRELDEKATRMLGKWLMALGAEATYLPLSNSINVVNECTSKLPQAVVFIQDYIVPG